MGPGMGGAIRMIFDWKEIKSSLKMRMYCGCPEQNTRGGKCGHMMIIAKKSIKKQFDLSRTMLFL